MGKSGVVNERSDVYSLLEKNKLDEFDEFVNKQNGKHSIWGWKRPKAIEYVDLFETKIRNPHYIIPFRDYVSIALRNQISVNADFKKNLKDTHFNRYRNVVDFIESNQQPVLLFSYEKAVTNKRYFVEKVAEFLGITDSQNVNNAINSIQINDNAYVNQDVLKGSIDLVKDGQVHGWAKQSKSAQPITLKVIVDNQFVKNIIANKPRKDLAKIGNHAFCDSFDEIGLEVGKSYEIVVCNQYDTQLKHSPKTYIHQ
jgi:hypothetical protein